MTNIDNINFPSGRKDSVHSGDKTNPVTPSNPPNARKDFKDLMSDEEEEKEIDPEDAKSQSPYALVGEPVLPEGVKEEGSLSATQLAGLNAKKEEGQTAMTEGKAEIGVAQQQSDSQMAGAQIGDNRAVMNRNEVSSLSEQIVDQLTTLQSKGDTTTTITIKHPPILEGATVTLSETNTAPKQLNIAFAGLSPQAMALLNSQASRVNLTNALATQGIVVHIITMTEQPEGLAAGESQRGQEERGEGQEQGQEQQEEDAHPGEEPTA